MGNKRGTCARSAPKLFIDMFIGPVFVPLNEYVWDGTKGEKDFEGKGVRSTRKYPIDSLGRIYENF